MAINNSDEFVRVVLQERGAAPINPHYEQGQNLISANMSAIEENVAQPVYIRVNGKWVKVATQPQEPGDKDFSLVFAEEAAQLHAVIAKPSCAYNVYLVYYACGVATRVKVLQNATRSSTENGDVFNRKDISEYNEITVVFDYDSAYDVVGVTAGTLADSVITTEVVGVIYADKESCGECGNPNDGSQTMYAAVAPITDVHQLVYQVDGGAVSILPLTTTPAVAASSPAKALAIAGNYAVVAYKTSASASGLVTTGLIDGVPQSGTSLNLPVANIGINDIVADGSKIWGAGEAGKVFFTRNAAALGSAPVIASGITSNALNRVVASGGYKVFGGVTMTLFYTNSDGNGTPTFTLVTPPNGSTIVSGATPAGTEGITALYADGRKLWIGLSSGRVYYTPNYRNAPAPRWYEVVIPNAGNAVSVNDIKAATPEVILIAHGARVYRAVNGGAAGETPADLGFSETRWIGGYAGTAQRINRIAVPVVGADFVKANTFYAAGLGASTDGILLSASATLANS